MATKLRIVSDSPSTSFSAEELLNAENVLRNEAKEMIKDISHKYWDLGRVLYDIYDGVPGGYRNATKGDGALQNRTSLFEKWGYKNFQEYCEQEVGLQKRTAENLRFTYYWFAIQQPMPKQVINELLALGRSKVYILAGHATIESIPLWIDKAKTLTADELKKAVKAAKALSAGKNVDDEERDVSGIEQEPSSGAVDSGGPVDNVKHLPKPEEWHQVSAQMADAQYETWQSAFKRAQGISNSEKVGHNLELICQDFLSNNDFSDVKEKDRSAYISKMERRMGVLIIAIDPATGKPIHGRDLLWRMINEKPEASE